MSSATKNGEQSTDMSESEPTYFPPTRSPSNEKPSFFTVYKKGQGYWTRMGTAGAAVLLIVVMAHFIWTELPANVEWFNGHTRILLGSVAGFSVLAALLCWHLMNKPRNVEFLISTDSEMKTVNWTSREELFGSTKIVIIFMLVIAVLLFVTDVLFGYFFYWIGVLKAPPF
jgi:preprotein translocase subunit SecE